MKFNLNDYIGKKYGKLTIVSDGGRDDHRRQLVICKCDCGGECVSMLTNIKRGNTTSCGCTYLKYEESDLIGKTFNRLTIIKEVERDEHKQRKVLCKCQCGKEKILTLYSVTNGVIKSCGCLTVESATTHGLTKQYRRLMSVWRKMKLRCYDIASKDYIDYGARGIKVCDEWADNVESFIEWGKKQEHWNDKEYSIDRIDVNGDYSPHNCRWATNHIQAANRRKKKTNTSGYTGVNYRKSDGYWLSYITINGKRIYTKCSKSKKECLDARNDYIIKNNLTEYPIQEWRDDE